MIEKLKARVAMAILTTLWAGDQYLSADDKWALGRTLHVLRMRCR